MTFSLVARCHKTGMFGVVISSSSPAVAARCARVRAGVGAVASQNVTNPALGPAVLDRLERGAGAEESVRQAAAADSHPDYRQVLAVDCLGRVAVHSGERALGLGGSATGQDCAAAGNLLANATIPAAMVAAFERAAGDFGSRLIAALRAGHDAGGEAGPVRSAGLLIAHRESWPWADLRCDWIEDACPIEAVARAWAVYAPQADAYVQRARDPREAPSYGVPGDP
jgi:uncharacterized Ntn-hydrolase superfamily protein